MRRTVSAGLELVIDDPAEITMDVHAVAEALVDGTRRAADAPLPAPRSSFK